MRDLANAVALPVADTWGMHGDVGTGWWIVLMVGMAVFWGAVVLAGVWLLRGALQGRHPESTDTPMDVLQRRFAEGVISAEDFEQRRKLLADADAVAPEERAGNADASLAGAGRSRSSGRRE
jgi:putative membrane protein